MRVVLANRGFRIYVMIVFFALGNTTYNYVYCMGERALNDLYIYLYLSIKMSLQNDACYVGRYIILTFKNNKITFKIDNKSYYKNIRFFAKYL